jgi:acyl-CoA synthetase (AMP-forming)/AMP-acid ligase II
MANDFKIKEDSTVPTILDDRIKMHPNQVALIMGEERVTYEEFGNRVNKIASAFVEIGIKPGEKVAMVLSTGTTFPAVMFAIFKVGGVAVAVNPTLNTHEIKHILSDCEAVAVVVQEMIPGVDVVEDINGIKKELPQLRQIIVHGEKLISPDMLLLNELEEKFDKGVDFYQVKPNDLAALIYSSGTTGKPKGSMHTHRNLLYPLTVDLVKTPSIPQMINMVKRYGFGYFRRLLRLISKPITLMYTMPPFTGAGMVATVMFLLSGRVSVLQERFSTTETLRLIEKEKINMFGAVPALAALLLRDREIAKRDISSLIYVGCGAAFVSPALVREIKDVLGCPTLISYGTTEMLGTPTSTDPFSDSEIQLRETVGKIQDGFELKIVDEDREDVSVGEVGEIALRSPSLMLGYYKAEELTREKIDKEGWYYTGDLGSLDEDGYLRIAGRIKDMIIRAGQNIYPAELEAVLVTHPKVNQVTVIGAPDDIAGEKVVAFVIPKEGVDLDQLEILDYCRETMAPYKIPHEVIFTNEFPMTPTGKVLKRILREQLVSEMLK